VIFFDGALAEYFGTVIYATDTQVNAVVPYEVSKWTNAYLQVGYVGGWYTTTSPNVQITQAVPSIFTASNGVGQAAALNQDGTVNSSANPATVGSVIQIFGTGEGQTYPAGTSGGVTCAKGCGSASDIPRPVLPVAVTIGGKPSTVTYAGEAPGLIAGVLQVNATIPLGLTAGPEQVSVIIGGAASQANVSVSVK